MSNAVEISNVSMRFNMAKEKVDSIKEYLIKFFKRQLLFEEFMALNDININIKKGEVFGLIGLNGSLRS